MNMASVAMQRALYAAIVDYISVCVCVCVCVCGAASVSADDRPVRLSSVLDGGMCRGQRLIHAASPCHRGGGVATVDVTLSGQWSCQSTQLGVIELVDQYNEMCLLAHAILNGRRSYVTRHLHAQTVIV